MLEIINMKIESQDKLTQKVFIWEINYNDLVLI